MHHTWKEMAGCLPRLTSPPLPYRRDTMSSDDDHYLGSYLSEILPAIGLDEETYAPYVTGYVSHKSLFLLSLFLTLK
jgi:hypothetical protein